jgi:hypothetical protein
MPLRRELENPELPADPMEPTDPDESPEAAELDLTDATPPGAGADRTLVELPPLFEPRLLDGDVEPDDRKDAASPKLPPDDDGGCDTPDPPPLEELPPPPPEDDDPPPPPLDVLPDEPPDEPPDDPPLVVRGMAWPSARTGVTSPTATTNDATWRYDLTMASAPGGSAQTSDLLG